MSTPSICPQCHTTNPSGALFCQNCGGSLTAARLSVPVPSAPSPWSSTSTPPPYGSPVYASLYGQGDRREKIDRTKNGLLLLITGSIIAFVPIIGGAIGAILAIIGAILVILGRDPFGKPHSDYVLWSIGLYIAGVVIVFVSAFGFGIDVFQAAQSGLGTAALVDTLTSAFNNLLVGAFIGSAVLGVAGVLFTYALQRPMGRVLLWAGYVGGLAIGIYVLSVIGSEVSSAVQAAFASGTFNRAPLDTLQAHSSNLKFLGIIPTIISDVAYYLAWSRITKGEIPEPLSPPSTPAGPIP